MGTMSEPLADINFRLYEIRHRLRGIDAALWGRAQHFEPEGAAGLGFLVSDLIDDLEEVQKDLNEAHNERMENVTET